jgi:hypothetical protein
VSSLLGAEICCPRLSAESVESRGQTWTKRSQTLTSYLQTLRLWRSFSAEIVKQRDDLLVDNAVKSATIQELESALESLSAIAIRRTATDLSNVVGLTITEAEPDAQPGLPELTEQRTDESPEPTESSNGEGPDDTNEPASDDVDAFLRNL